jgi:hypothetical protein
MARRATIDDCRLIELPRVVDVRGSLSFLEGGKHLPFDIKRAFYIYDVPTGESRGAHAHWSLQQFLVCLSGGFEVEVDDGQRSTVIKLNRPWIGLLVPPMIWASERNFDTGSICLALVSDLYDESDYIRDRQLFLDAVRVS